MIERNSHPSLRARLELKLAGAGKRVPEIPGQVGENGYKPAPPQLARRRHLEGPALRREHHGRDSSGRLYRPIPEQQDLRVVAPGYLDDRGRIGPAVARLADHAAILRPPIHLPGGLGARRRSRGLLGKGRAGDKRGQQGGGNESEREHGLG